MAGKIPRWESELWSYISSGDGMCCPLRSHCQAGKECGWCPDKNIEHINQLLDNRQCNLHSCDFMGSEDGRLGRVFQLVELLARKYLKMGKIRCTPVPTGLVALADEQHTIETRLLPLKAHHGAIWYLREGWVIQLKGDDTSASKRFTLFHEAFHILAHCRTTPVFRKRGTIQGSFNELLADYFAACILMPREWVREKWAEVKNLDRMAEIFDVPKSAMCIRLRQLGLV